MNWDNEILLWINGHHTPFLDDFMWYVSQPLTWLPLYLLIIAALIYAFCRYPLKQKPHQNPLSLYHLQLTTYHFLPCLAAIAAIALSVGLSDFITSGLIKPLVARPRPSHSELEPLLHLVRNYHGGAYGFPSSHAANCWAVCLSSCLILRHALHYQLRKNRTKLHSPFTTYHLPLTTYLLVSYALLNCYSRMYLGVHYPSDILVGSLIGLLIAYLLYRLYLIAVQRLIR